MRLKDRKTLLSNPPSTDQDRDWQQAKQRMANREQRDEIVKHQAKLARETGRTVSLDEAARDWITTFAEEWRAAFERRIAQAAYATPKQGDAVRE